MTDLETQPETSRRAGRDSIRLAVTANRLNAIVERMSNTLFRTARSGVLNAARDFSCCIVSADNQLVMAGDSLPIHVMSGPDIICRTMCERHPRLDAGDAFLHNSPYHGNSHAADHCLLVPVVVDGVHRFTVVVKAHQADCGNARPTTYMPDAEDVYAEGALIFPAVKVQRDYEDIDDIIAMCEMRLRVPTQWRGDYLAMVGAARTGERELLALGADLGWDELADLCDDWLDYSEETVAAAISRLPAGSARGHTTYDPIPESPGGIEIGATVVVDPDAAHISVDLTDNADCLPCGLNLSEACARTAALIGIFNSLGASVPHNAGSFRRIDVTLRANCIVGIPWHPTSTSAATTNVSDRVIGAVQLALAEIEEDAGMAEFGAVMPGSAAVIAGSDPRTGERFVNQLLLAMTGGAASPRCDGWLTACHAGNGGLIYYDSIEMDELAFPILINQRRLAPDTEGAGRSRGAPSALVEYGPIEGAEMSALYSADGSVNPARGARGGGAGGLSRHRKVGADGSVTDLAPSPGTALRAGERIQSWTSGGGGYGDPFRRDLEAVALDVREGWVSPRRAADVYGVAVAADGAIDEERTRELRTGTGEGGDDE